MKRIKALAVGTAIAAALGFGAAQALAAPQAEGDARACSRWACPECGSLGGQWVPMDGKCYCCG